MHHLTLVHKSTNLQFDVQVEIATLYSW